LQNIIFYARRLGALLYDGFLLVAFWLLATFCLVLAKGHGLVAPGTGTVAKAPYWLFLLVIAWAFFSWFWSHGGQTLGMRAWKLQLHLAVRHDENREKHPSSVSWGRASQRFVVTLAVWIVGAAVVITPVWDLTTSIHLPFATRVTALLFTWIAVSFLLSLVPICHGKTLIDTLSGTSIVSVA
jgi:uncharacterized RDD family membrane protein YckC